MDIAIAGNDSDSIPFKSLQRLVKVLEYIKAGEILPSYTLVLDTSKLQKTVIPTWLYSKEHFAGKIEIYTELREVVFTYHNTCGLADIVLKKTVVYQDLPKFNVNKFYGVE